MSEIDVNVDDSLRCMAVHYWQRTDEQVRQQFSEWGFNGIKNLQREGPHLNGNAARKEVVAMAKKQDAKWYFRGNYDWSAVADAQIYSFSYSSYTGDMHDGTGDWEYFAGWSGHK